ncbi:hypothetical protein M2128_000130 [Polynucleobacter sphagniphilus]|nr:hypothetical protein [Polynucleobacter sphagniphilus]MDH6301228.1 hypothetical protein [Polynucleobacter sphagniphilus]
MMKKHLILSAFFVATSLAFADDYVGQNGYRIRGWMILFLKRAVIKRT